jgi:hypothetical protein
MQSDLQQVGLSRYDTCEGQLPEQYDPCTPVQTGQAERGAHLEQGQGHSGAGSWQGRVMVGQGHGGEGCCRVMRRSSRIEMVRILIWGSHPCLYS